MLSAIIMFAIKYNVSEQGVISKQFDIMAILSPNSLNIKMEPNQEVRFSGDFRESTIECLTLRNPGRIPLLFKV